MEKRARSTQSLCLGELRAALDRHADILSAHEKQLPSVITNGTPIANWHAALEETAQQVELAFLRWRETRERRH